MLPFSPVGEAGFNGSGNGHVTTAGVFDLLPTPRPRLLMAWMRPDSLIETLF